MAEQQPEGENASPPLPAYELQRLRQIAANEAKLSELGLSSTRSRPRTPAAKRPKRVPAAPSLPVRRSARAAEQAKQSDALVEARASHVALSASHEATPLPRERGEPSAAGISVAEAAAERVAAAAASEGSSRSAHAILEALARLGVGMEIPGPPTKASVMEFASANRCPKFSKYSGSIEWVNAVFLFVNVGGSDYKNQFLDSGRRMSWFAGGRQDASTPLIQRMLGPDAPPLLLFCRLQGVGGPPSPYVFCGRVSYEQHYPSSHPLEVEWRLADSEALARSERFQELLKVARKG